jgi:hypothetical protein
MKSNCPLDPRIAIHDSRESFSILYRHLASMAKVFFSMSEKSCDALDFFSVLLVRRRVIATRGSISTSSVDRNRLAIAIVSRRAASMRRTDRRDDDAR